MKRCALVDTADVERYFYGEFDPVDRARVEGHLRGCESCRQRLEDLHAIRHALAARSLSTHRRPATGPASRAGSIPPSRAKPNRRT